MTDLPADHTEGAARNGTFTLQFRAFCQRHTATILATGGFILFWAAYVLVFHVTIDQPFRRSLSAATNNIVPAAGLAILAWMVLDRFVLQRRLALQVAAHLILALVYATTWYVLVVTVQSVEPGWLEDGFSVRPFAYVAFVWQMFQGVTLYAVIAGFTYAVHFRRQLTALRAERDMLIANRTEDAEPAQRKAANTLLVRRDDEIISISLGDIVRITGAGDYTEVVTAKGSSLSTTTLAEFETLLPEDRFVRVHRSHIVNLDAVASAEPAGNGRLSLHLNDRTSVIASRTGTRRFRAATV